MLKLQRSSCNVDVEEKRNRSQSRHVDAGKKLAGGVLLPKSAIKFERYLMREIVLVIAEVGKVEPRKKINEFRNFLSNLMRSDACQNAAIF
ncbi:hypothetical protein Goshw_018123, partial [Gossypium schwendimanii]|nr:hypothetical protein [Gossypium schwendimanii]